ncbi:MAG TPA: signal recognition particle-docking protein FtsY [Gemmatimonadales bacterium]|nr:signal recognition particle-docking protein FtsY [Gemmatimonadales bacterium]
MSLWDRMRRVFGRATLAERDAAERLLLEADFGVTATTEILDRLSRVKDGELQQTLERTIADLLTDGTAAGGRAPGELAHADRAPTIILVFGVNGVGKTTTVAKLARRLIDEGRPTLLAAADTFRPGAVDQLRIWADRLGAPCVSGGERSDPAAVAFDAISAAKARGVDTVLVDTAGRLHTDERLLEELKKVVRVADKAHPASGAPHESLLVLDGTTGQNAVQQGKTFAAAIPLTGLIVTKLDGTAKGGSVIALRREVSVPVRFIGTGEALGDLEPFDPEQYARRIMSA